MLTPVPGGIDVPTQQLGEQSCNLLFSLIAGEKGLQNITVGTQISGNDSNLLIVFYVQIMPDDFVMQLHRF